jgi:hypothetical protein
LLLMSGRHVRMFHVYPQLAYASWLPTHGDVWKKVCFSSELEDLCHFLLLCPAFEKIRRPLLNDISFNTVEFDFVDLPNYIKIKLLIGDCGWQYIKSHHIHKTAKIYMINKTSVIYKNNRKKKHELNHKTFDCAKIIFLSWYSFVISSCYVLH